MNHELFNDLLFQIKPQRFLLELTLRCNLKCAYCESILPEYTTPRIDKDPAALNTIIDYLIEHKPKGVCVSGYGETTIYKNWHHYCNRLLDAGIALTMICNLAKEYSPEELETLSRFSGFQVSCDTSDPELFKKLRLGNTLERFTGNMEKIRDTARRAGRTPPPFTWSCVVCDQTVFGLIKYIEFGLKCGVRSFYMCNYATFLDVNKRLEPKRITEMAPGQFLKAAQIIFALKERLDRVGIDFSMVQGLEETINDKLQSLATGIENSLPQGAVATLSEPCAQLPENGTVLPAQTRFCFEPWYNCFIRADNEVRPCCTFDTTTRLGPATTIVEAYNSPEIVDLRRSLLSGDLKAKCRVCPHVGMRSVIDFRNAMRQKFGSQPATVVSEQVMATA